MNMIYKQKTLKSFDEALESLKSNLAKAEFGVLWQLNLKDKLHEKGLSFEDNFLILEVCNPVKAQQVLTERIEMGFFLPCKVAIYESQGHTFIGMPKPTALIASEVDDNETLNALAEEVETILKRAIEQSV